MNIEDYTTANSWYSAMRGEGYEVPVTLLQDIEKVMKKEKLTFSEAYKGLEEKGLVTIEGKTVTYKLKR